MIVGIGIDLVELDRIEKSLDRFGKRFLERIMTQAEIDSAWGKEVEYAAGRFAGKEAASKALGTGFAQGVTPRDFEILHLESGKPTLNLHGKAKELAQQMGVKSTHISLTHSRQTAAAVAILEA